MIPVVPPHVPPGPDVTPSPCVRLCTLDDEEVCLGCGRTLADITAWRAMSEPDKAACVRRADARRQARLTRGKPP